MKVRDDAVFVDDILEEARRIEEFIEGRTKSADRLCPHMEIR